MTDESARWWFRSRGTAPDQGYKWMDWSGAAVSTPPGMQSATALSKPGSLSIVCWQSDGEIFVFADGLHADGWPRDHQGRWIELSIAAAASTDAAIGELAAALRAFTAETSAARTALSAAITFHAAEPGYSVNADSWARLLEAGRCGIVGAGLDPTALRWIAANRSGLAEETSATCQLIQERQVLGAAVPGGNACLLAVSDLVSDEDIPELGAYRLIGRNLTPSEGKWPGSSSVRGPRDPKDRAVVTPHRKNLRAIVVLILIAAAVATALILFLS